jgi:hypothetical protein
MMTRDDVEKLPIGTIVRALVPGGGGVYADDDSEECREFEAGDLLTITALDVYDSSQGLAVTVQAGNSVVNVFDAADFDGLYPFATLVATDKAGR